MIWKKLLLIFLILGIVVVMSLLAFAHFIAIPTFNDIENRPIRPALIR